MNASQHSQTTECELNTLKSHFRRQDRALGTGNRQSGRQNAHLRGGNARNGTLSRGVDLLHCRMRRASRLGLRHLGPDPPPDEQNRFVGKAQHLHDDSTLSPITDVAGRACRAPAATPPHRDLRHFAAGLSTYAQKAGDHGRPRRAAQGDACRRSSEQTRERVAQCCIVDAREPARRSADALKSGATLTNPPRGVAWPSPPRRIAESAPKPQAPACVARGFAWTPPT
jgi:hypothetical protein